MGLLKSVTAAALPHAAVGAAISAKSFLRARAILPHYLQQIRDEFPQLPFSKARLIDSGLENVIVMLDEAWVFRFPRSDRRHLAFKHELQLLAALQGHAAIDVPHYRHVASGERFGGYPLVNGEPLGAALFRSLDRTGQCRALDQFADFLNALHGLPSRQVYGEDQPRRETPRKAFAALYFQQQRKYLAYKIGQGLQSRIDRFFESYALPEAHPERIVHGDIDDHHVLFDRQTRRLGVIDFGDNGLGDPATDFAYLFTLPAWAAERVFARYAFLRDDPGLPERALRHSVRFAVSRMWNCFQHEGFPRLLSDTRDALDLQLSLLDA